MYGDAVEGEDPDKPKGGKKKVKIQTGGDGQITVYKLKRGKKTICLVKGFEHYTQDLKKLAQGFSKKFACSSSLTTDDIYGEVITIQGDIEYDFMDYMEDDKKMQELKVPSDKIVFEDKGNKKGRKK